MQDAIGRRWQCSTCQLDFNLPERFDMAYFDSDNAKQRPIMLHRAILGSIERFFGILIENFAGAFPVWLAPTQCRLLPVNDSCEQYCTELKRRMMDSGIRVDLVRCCIACFDLRSYGIASWQSQDSSPIGASGRQAASAPSFAFLQRYLCLPVGHHLNDANDVLILLFDVIEVQASGEKLGKLIRNAEMEKIPVVCVVGQRDIEAGAVSVRTYADGELGQLPVDDVLARLSKATAQRTQF